MAKNDKLCSKVLVCFALKQEAAPFIKRVRDNPQMATLVTGMGLANADRAVRSALANEPFHTVFSCGFAAGLDPTLATGTVLFHTDRPELREILQKSGAVSGRFVLVQNLLISARDKHAIFKRTKADAAQYESEAIQAICRQHNIPFAVVRVILDTANENLPLDFNRFLYDTGRFSYTKFFMALGCAPHKIWAIVHLARRCTAAAHNLAQVLTTAVNELCSGVVPFV